MKFADWLKKYMNEVSTSTGDVANFARPIMGDPQRRKFAEPVALQSIGFKKVNPPQ